MKNLWAPWRIDYIRAPKDGHCFLCAMFNGTDDEETFVLYRGATCAVVMNRFPYTGGHLMICPYRHIANFSDLTREERLEIMDLTETSMNILRSVMNPQGFNLGYNLGEAAGAGLKEHLHQHIVPRWIGDTNIMPVLGGVTVVPQAMRELYRELKPKFDA
ncbi:MAG: HIT domain-containing protein [Kiritimatiellae bacterium]|nr:HIT domain-containing protein [Kiritimatiellia bacterium]